MVEGRGRAREQIGQMVGVVEAVEAGAVRYLEDGAADPALTALVERQIRLLDRPGQGMLVHDAGHRVLHINFNLREFVGIDWPMQADDLAPGWALVGLDGVPLRVDQMPRARVLATGLPVNGQRVGVRDPDGRVRWVMASAYPVNDAGGTTVAAITTVVGDWYPGPGAGHGIGADRGRAPEAPLPVDGPQAVVTCDADRVVTYVNREAEARYGCTADGAVGRPLDEVVTWAVCPDQIPALAMGGSIPEPWSGEVWSRRSDGSCQPAHLTVTPIVLGDGSVLISTVAIDRSERHAADEASRHASLHDPLTGLANRALFVESIEDPTASGTQHGPSESVLVALLDLDDFRVLNDALGREAGDQVVRACARALEAAVHRGDTVGRLSNGSFGVVCHHTSRHGDVRSYVDRLRQAVAAPMVIDGRQVSVRSSAGAVSCSEHPCDAEQLIHRAHLALSRAKADGKDRCGLYDEGMARQVERELELEQFLRRVIADKAVVLGYQPIVELDQQLVTGAEALLRLAGPDGEPISAFELVSVAERRGLIGDLGLVILEVACAEAARWRQELPERPLSVSVNVSAAQLDDPDLADKVIAVLAETGLEPARLNLEMTESILMRDSDHSASQLARLKMAGVRLSADDFGTGYSSLAYLKRFPLDVVKADLSFVAGLPHSPEDVGVVGAIMGVASALGLQVVAEGVERADQLACLRDLGCELGQGYLWGRAVPGDAFLDLLATIEAAPPRPRRAAGELPPRPPGASTLRLPVGAVEAGLDTAFRTFAHEVRTPLTVVNGYAALIEQDVGDAPRLGALIRRAGGQIDHLVTELEDVRALDAGVLHLVPEPVDVLAAVELAIADLTVSSGVDVRLERLVIGRPTVLGDASRLLRAVANLVTNAVKHSPVDGLVLVMVARRARWVEVSVHDDGPGVAPANVGLIFRKYGRVDPSLPGTGLGLYLARGIARAHGGDIVHANGRRGVGSIFTLRLPIAPAPAEPPGRGAVPSFEGGASAAPTLVGAGERPQN